MDKSHQAEKEAMGNTHKRSCQLLGGFLRRLVVCQYSKRLFLNLMGLSPKPSVAARSDVMVKAEKVNGDDEEEYMLTIELSGITGKRLSCIE
ncbi:hypothetical protein Tco_0626078 [Tanacetum coccineum]|uniref:Uncharacterized protein n=1 Tax=Tanacetum coccineum TaxID=301880 RepID=A0ABQ4WIK6_9ASTR